jgi:murein L,D-transpeptidase YcbB/YkuD
MTAACLVFIFVQEPVRAEAILDGMPDSMPAAVQRVLELAAAATATVTVAGKPIDVEPLRMFYEQRQNAPAWVEPVGANVRAHALLKALRDAAQDGLDPTEYDPGPLVTSGYGTETLAVSDVALSAALLRYALDVRQGRTMLSKPDQHPPLTLKPVDPVQILSAAAVAPDPKLFVEGLAPADPFYQGLRQALAGYRVLAAAGGWTTLPDGPKLAVGHIDPRVPILRFRLEVTGDLPAGTYVRSENRFDDDLRQALSRFQARHGLPADGVLGPRTRDALNVPADARVRQLLVNLERARWLPEELGDPYVLVNMAAFQLEVVEAGRPALDMRVVVGRPARSTPAFSDEITYLELNPYWHVPRTILIEDKLPILRSNPGVLTAQGIRVIAPGGVRVDPTVIDWSTVSARNFPYTLRQDPGERNALGRIKFMFPNAYDIYLHDTPSRGLFRRPMRAFSSGCIRVERPLDLAEYLLRANGDWSRERIQRAIAAGKNRSVTLAKPVPVHLLYLTAWMGRDGRVQFRDDFYNRDGRLVAAMEHTHP